MKLFKMEKLFKHEDKHLAVRRGLQKTLKNLWKTCSTWALWNMRSFSLISGKVSDLSIQLKISEDLLIGLGLLEL